MKLDYMLFVLIYPLLFALLQAVAPDLPAVFSVDVFAALFAYVLTKAGVVIVGAPAVRWLQARIAARFAVKAKKK
jgi:hypothetical protein